MSADVTAAMVDEFDLVAGWTAEAVARLGARHALPAACRGSGSPAALDWLLDRMRAGPRTTLLDVGAGMGGPAAYALRTRNASPLVVDPMWTACVTAARLFGLRAVAADGAAVPFADGSFDSVWSLGVLCTVEHKALHLAEIARVVRPGGRVGLLVFERMVRDLPDQPDGNAFPSADETDRLLDASGLTIEGSACLTDFPGPPRDWQSSAEAVDDWIARHHSGEAAWQRAHEQESRLGSLIERDLVTGRVLVAHASPSK